MDWLKLIVAIVGLLGMAGLIVWMLRRTAVRWSVLSGWPTVMVSGVGDEDLRRVEAAYTTAVRALTAVWPAAAEWAGETRLVVHPEPGWCPAEGRCLSGLTWVDLGLIEVGSDLAALAHELAHLLQWRIDRRTDPEHLNWEALGINAAVGAYRL